MPPLWIDHSLWILNGHLRLLSTVRWSKAPGQEQFIEIDNTVDDIVLRLQEVLLQAPHGPLRMDGLEVHVGSPWIKYDIVPWQEGLRKPGDWADYARIIMGQHFDTDAMGWHVTVSEGDYGESRVAASIDEVLYQAILSFAKSQRLQIRAFDTALFATANMFADKLVAPEFALVVLEQKHTSYAFHRDGVWQGVGSFPMRSEQPDGSQLAALLRDAAMLSSNPLPKQVYLSSYSRMPRELQSMAGFTPSWLGLSFPQEITAR
ncbi:hypothetical protein WKW79_12740 [Variovorax robiniae]|uniref:DUF3396 domain-containing protein n=1 Tax=Variovorax robiniae TaxID=1836199 RepID=A0ABU8X6J9_9BURK